MSLAKEPPVGRSWSCLWSLEESDRQGPLGGEGGWGELVGTDRRGKRGRGMPGEKLEVRQDGLTSMETEWSVLNFKMVCVNF